MPADRRTCLKHLMSLGGLAAAAALPASMARSAAANPANTADDPAAEAAVQAAASPPLLLRNVRVFDGTATQLSALTTVRVEGARIAAIGGQGAVPAGATVIDGGGRTLMPGLIDAHAHIMLAELSQVALMASEIGFVNIAASRTAETMLMQGFTAVRDLGGPVFGLKRAIDAGLVRGPRIWPSGAMISQTSGHGDFRLPGEVPAIPGALSYADRLGVTAIADGVPLVQQRVREQLRAGASQIKMMAGGGVSSVFDPIDVTQFSDEELRAGVEAAADWGTYVAVHAYTPRAMRRAVQAGVKVIDHGQLADEDTVRLMAARGVWWSLQPFLDDEHSNPMTGQARVKQLMVASGTDRAYELAQRHGVRIAWGTDTLHSPRGVRNMNRQLTKMTRWFTAAQILRMATADNGELLALAGPRSPYPGRVGVIQPEAMADLLLVDGDPLRDIVLLADPGRNFRLIIKDGQIVKNTLAS